jgi:hypothetical protein
LAWHLGLTEDIEKAKKIVSFLRKKVSVYHLIKYAPEVSLNPISSVMPPDAVL